MQPDSIRAAHYIMGKYPQIQTIGGWRPSDPYPDHPSGRALDIMIPAYQMNVALGSAIRDDLHANGKALGLVYTIWQQEYWGTDGRNMMEDRGDDTQNHRNHVHATFEGNAGSGPVGAGGSSGGMLSGIGNSISDAGEVIASAAKVTDALMKPETWLRIGKFVGGGGLIAFGVWKLVGAKL